MNHVKFTKKKQNTPPHMYSCEFSEVFQCCILAEQLRATVSQNYYIIKSNHTISACINVGLRDIDRHVI